MSKLFRGSWLSWLAIPLFFFGLYGIAFAYKTASKAKVSMSTILEWVVALTGLLFFLWGIAVNLTQRDPGRYLQYSPLDYLFLPLALCALFGVFWFGMKFLGWKS